MSDEALVRVLEKFGTAWNQHDTEGLMACMPDECVSETVGGPEVYGARHEGVEAVRKAFESAWRTIPDAQWANTKVGVTDEQGVMETQSTAHTADGARHA